MTAMKREMLFWKMFIRLTLFYYYSVKYNDKQKQK